MPIKFVLKRNSRSSPTTNNQILAEFPFESNLFTIGSDAANNLVLAGTAFEQAVVVEEGAQLMLINSADGTKVNGETLRREAIQPLNIGDEIGIGDYSVFIVDSEQSAGSDNGQTNVFTTNEDEIIDVYATTKFDINELGEPIPETSPSSIQISPQAQRGETPAPVNNGQPPPENAPPKNFADILDTLRTEDDSFYFTVKNAAQDEVKRITIDQAEMPLGISPGGEIVGGEAATVCAVARKDWSGILIESQKSGAVSVNGAKISEPQRLRHDDEIIFSASPKYSLILHEPSSLVALESLLSSRSTPNSRFGLGANNQPLANVETVPEKVKKQSFLERRYFKHFSFVELISMIIGTLIGAVLIFLLLEFIFS